MRKDLLLYFALACGITWLLDSPIAFAWSHHQVPPPWALPMAGLGALGPLLAANIVAKLRGERVFARGGDHRWAALALVTPLALQAIATAIEVALGGNPAQWFYPPVQPEHFAALFVFSIAEEFGWRGYAWPRISQDLGPVIGALVLGGIWGLWHLGMSFSPEGDVPSVGTMGFQMFDMALWSVIFGWFYLRSGGSILVAISLHMGGHLDNINRAPFARAVSTCPSPGVSGTSRPSSR